MFCLRNFPDYVANEIKDINFEKIYLDIYEKEEYIPTTLINCIQLTIYHLEFTKKLKHEDLATLSFYLSVITGQHETKKSLSKIELLYLIYKLDTLTTTTRTSTDKLNLYM